MPARLKPFSSKENPRGSIKWSWHPVFTDKRIIFPALGGISGSNKII
jgi:hypothetical protein